MTPLLSMRLATLEAKELPYDQILDDFPGETPPRDN